MTRLTPRLEQEEAIALALGEIGRSNGCLVGDEPGAGKTLLATEFALRAMVTHGWTRILLIGLPNTHKQWQASFEAQSDGQVIPRIMNGTTKAGRANYEAFMKHEPGVFIAGSVYLTEKDWDTVPQFLDDGTPKWKIDKKTGQRVLNPKAHPPLLPYVQVTKAVRRDRFARFARKPLDAVIYDEVHTSANKKSHNRATIRSIMAHAGYRLAMSGTWFLNSVANQWSIARLVWPGEDPATGESYVDPNYHRWVARYLVSEPVRGKGGRVLTTKYGGAITKVVGEANPGEFVRTLPAYRRLENEDRPPEPIVIRVDPTPEQRDQMEDLEADLMTWITTRDGGEMPLVADIPLIKRMRLRQVAIAELTLTGDESVVFADDAASAKLTPLRYLIEERWKGQPVAVLTDSKIGAHFITKRMRAAGYDARAWTGDLTQKQREELKDAFIAGEFDYLVGTIPSMGVGIDGLQKRVNKVAWINEVDGNPALNEQALARFFRQGRVDPEHFEQVKLVLRGSVDETSMAELVSKAWTMRTAMNGGKKA